MLMRCVEKEGLGQGTGVPPKDGKDPAVSPILFPHHCLPLVCNSTQQTPPLSDFCSLEPEAVA